MSPQQSAAHPLVLSLPLPVEIEDALTAARAAWFRQFSAKEIARAVNCKIETAERYRTGSMPNGPQLAAMLSHWGPAFLEAIFEPVLNPAGETVDQRLARIEREAAAARRQLTLERREWERREWANEARAGAADPRGADAAGGSAGVGGASRAVGAEDAPPLRQSLRGVGGRGVLALAALCVLASGWLTALTDEAQADMRRPPGGVRARPPIVRIYRGAGPGMGGARFVRLDGGGA